ncbi:MAG: beta-L-arabinofuranosidase domain-containing protein [Verrucomicrobiota bacterium]
MKIMNCILGAALLTTAGARPATASTNKFYPANRPPLRQTAYVALPLGAVKPAGWLKDQLTIQANGLTGHLDEFWPDLLNSAWKGKDGEGWERGPYYLDGLVPLAYLLDDARLKAMAQRYLDWTLASGKENGWFGPEKNKDRWPLAVAMKVLTQYHEATNDPRIIPLLKNYFTYLKNTPPDWPDKEWRGVRAMENTVTAYWLYNRTGDPDVLKVAESIFRNSFDWTSYFLKFPYPADVIEKGVKHGHPTHVVNIAMAVKHPGVWYQQSGDDRFKQAVYQGIKSLDEHHGQAGGRFAGDEHLSGRRPTQGTELCAVVEYMFSLENLVEILGDAALADRLEMLAYNCQPGTCTPDYWAHQYDQQANQVLCTKAKRKWSTNGDFSNLYGLEPNYGCCTANMHQGWPKFVSHLWMATHDQGLAAVTYGPSEVKAKAGDGTEVTVLEETNYPFDGAIRFTLKLPRETAFPLHLRIPNWANGATLKVKGRKVPAAAGSFAVVNRTWKSGDVIELNLPLKLRIETRYRNAVSILRGPLVFSLKIGEDFRKLKAYQNTWPVADWEVYPTTPWNYGLLLDEKTPEKSIQVETRTIGKIPFAQENAPVVLKVKGRAIAGWDLADHSAGETPASPVQSGQPDTQLELIPYGSTRLRITEFPVVAAASERAKRAKP